MMKNLFNMSLSTLAALVCIHASASGILIENVRVFDGEKNLGERNVLIVNQRIDNIDFHGTPAADVKTISGKGRTLLPGLIDAHVHAFKDQELPTLYGVTTEIDMFTAVPALREFNEQIRQARPQRRADVFSAGMLATAPGGHGTEYGIQIDTLTKPEQAQAWVDARIAEGSHFIKIVMESGWEAHTYQSLDNATVKALIDAAHLRHQLAVVHISNLKDAQIALDAGADGLVHLFTGQTIKDEDLRRLVETAKRQHAFVIPTFSVLESIAGVKPKEQLSNSELMALLSASQKQILSLSYGQAARPEILHVPKQTTAALYAAGVPILAGTDAGNNGTQYGISLHHELRALVEAGLPPEAALQAATAAPAKAFQLKDRGRIANGYLADLLLVEGEPDRHIEDTSRIVEVWKHGEAVSDLRQQKIASVAMENKNNTVAQALPADGRISLFSKDKLASPFGMGWFPSTDAVVGGKSTLSHQIAGQEPGGQTALALDAKVQSGFVYPWAGIAFFPGQNLQQGVNLSKASVLKFKVRGDGKTYSAGISVAGSYIPLSTRFVAGAEWKEVSIPFKQVAGLNPEIITSIGFNAGPEAGDYHFELADVRLLAE
jgi:imidazolonepropionase-like amidohydrolase